MQTFHSSLSDSIHIGLCIPHYHPAQLSCTTTNFSVIAYLESVGSCMLSRFMAAVSFTSDSRNLVLQQNHIGTVGELLRGLARIKTETAEQFHWAWTPRKITK